MKITPVTGSSPINGSVGMTTGLSADKLARLKSIAAGETPPEITENEPKKASNGLHTIRRQTNFTTNRDDVSQQDLEIISEAQNNPPPSTEQSTTAISDTGEQTNKAPEATEPLSPQLAALAKERRALQLRGRAIADREKALSEREKALEGPTRADLEARIKAKPLSVLQELGVTYDQLTNDILAAQNGGASIDLDKFKADLTKDLTENFNKTLSEKDAAQEQAVLTEIRRNVDAMAAQGDDFEMIRRTESQPDVVSLIHRTYKQTGEVMSEVEAMRLVEAELVKDYLALADVKKVKGTLPPPEAPLQQQPQTGIRTLTNKDQARPQLTRRQRAIAAALGQLKR